MREGDFLAGASVTVLGGREVAVAGTGRYSHASRALRVPAGPACGWLLTRGALRPWAGMKRAGAGGPALLHAPATSRPSSPEQQRQWLVVKRPAGDRSLQSVCGNRVAF